MGNFDEQPWGISASAVTDGQETLRSTRGCLGAVARSVRFNNGWSTTERTEPALRCSVILNLVRTTSYSVALSALVLCVAACSSGGGKQASATATTLSPSPISDTTTPLRCAVRAGGSPGTNGTPAPESDFPPTDALAPPGTRAKTGRQAINAALAFGVTNGRTPRTTAATVTEISYRSAQTALGKPMDSRIAPTRCVWKVTVDATYYGPTGGGLPSKPAVTVAPAKSYSVIFDVNSGLMVEIVPGR